MPFRIIAGACVLIATGLLAGFLWLATEASPVYGGPALAGLALGDFETGVRIAGRHLSCADSGPAALQATCAVDVAGQPLRVEVVYADADRVTFPRCQVRYAAREAACEAALFVVQGPAWAQVEAGALGLTTDDLQTLAARFPGSQWNEANWTWTGFWAALGAALLLGLTVGRWVAPQIRARRFWIVAGLSSLAFFFAFTIGLMTVISGLALID
jgi:hypothetical protein